MSLLRLQSDERLIAFIRRGNGGAFEALVARYETRLLAFCRHLLGSREDAEDVLQEVLSAAFNAIVADERPINVRPWLYRIARNRSLNHLRKIRTIGVDSMDAHFSDNGASTADKVHERDAFRMLVGDIHELPETQKTALVLREMDALSYEQIAEAMETTVPSVKSLLVRARVSLAEAAEARLLSCEEVRIELGEIAEGLRRRPTPLVRRHLRACKRCATFRTELKRTNKALAALMPVGPLLILKKLAIVHLGHSAGSGAGAAGAGSGATAAGSGVAAVGSGAAGASAAGSFAVAGSTGGFVSAGMGVIAAKAAAGLAAAAIVTASAVGIDHSAHRRVHHQAVAAASAPAAPAALKTAPATTRIHVQPTTAVKVSRRHETKSATKATFVAATVPAKAAPPAAPAKPTTTTLAGRTSKQSDPTVLPPAASTPPAPPPLTAPAPSTTGSAPPADDPTSTSQASTPPPASTTPTGPAPTSGTSTTPTGPTPPPSGGGSGGSGGTDPGSGTGGGTDPGGTPPEPPAPPSGAPPAVAP